MSSEATIEPPPVPFGDILSRIVAWARRDPIAAFLLLASAGVLIYFFGFYKVFASGAESTAQWAWSGWNEENDQEHCVFIVPIIAFLFSYTGTN